MALLCKQFPYNDDNYGFLLHDDQTGNTAAIDAGCAPSYLSALQETGWNLTHILITHHHGDHVAGLAELKQATNAIVYGPKNTKQSLQDLIDNPLCEGDSLSLGRYEFTTIETPGHTLDMLNYHCADNKMLFSGDSLFVLGCGRLFEGDAPMMWHSLQKLRALPHDTMVYSAHEYALANAAFAISVDPQNKALQDRVSHIKNLRDKDLPTVPSSLAQECETNPFLRPDDEQIREHLNMMGESDEAVFTEIRARKDRF